MKGQLTGLYVSLWARAPRHFMSLVKGTLWGHVSTGAFQGHQGNYQGAWRQSPLLPPWSIKPEFCLFNNLTVPTTGQEWKLHRQEMSVHRECSHPRANPVGCRHQDEDAENGGRPQGLSALHQEVQSLWETPQNDLRTLVTLLQVCGGILSYLLSIPRKARINPTWNVIVYHFALHCERIKTWCYTRVVWLHAF